MSAGIALVGVHLERTVASAWAYSADGEIITRSEKVPIETRDGQGTELVQKFVESALGHLVDRPILACGELQVRAGALVQVPTLLSAVSSSLIGASNVHIVPGLKQLSPADMLQGQETLLIGLGHASGAICLPGYHTRHVVLDQGRVLDFSTEMTGEIIELLESRGSFRVLDRTEQEFDSNIFRDWVERSLDIDDAASPFSVGAARQIGLLRPEHQSVALSGLMIGADVAAHYDPGDEVMMVADGGLAVSYGIALDALGVSVEEYSATEAVQDGLFEIAEEAGLLDQ